MKLTSFPVSHFLRILFILPLSLFLPLTSDYPSLITLGLHHEGIVSFIELDEDDEHYYVVMELVEVPPLLLLLLFPFSHRQGNELFDQIMDRGCFEHKDAACVVAQVLKSLEYMHHVGTAHRDIKPENILYQDEVTPPSFLTPFLTLRRTSM